MRTLTAALLVLPLCLMTTSCASLKHVTGKAGCTTKMGGGGECSVSVEARWEGGERRGSLLYHLLSRTGVAPDSQGYVLDISDSTVPYPAHGQMEVIMSNAATGRVVASRRFDWVRSGNVIRARDPDEVNRWAYANAGDADTLGYELDPFVSSYGPGRQVIAGASSYEGQELNRFAVVFDGTPDCPGYPTVSPCRE